MLWIFWDLTISVFGVFGDFVWGFRLNISSVNIVTKPHLNFYFHTSLQGLKRFSEGPRVLHNKDFIKSFEIPQRSVKTNIFKSIVKFLLLKIQFNWGWTTYKGNIYFQFSIFLLGVLLRQCYYLITFWFSELIQKYQVFFGRNGLILLGGHIIILGEYSNMPLRFGNTSVCCEVKGFW